MEDSNINIDFVQAGEYDNAGQDTTPQDSNADSLHIRQNSSMPISRKYQSCDSHPQRA